MDLDNIKRGLRAEIKKRENEQYLTFQCNVRQMCKDDLAKLEEQESEIAELKAQKAQAEDDCAYWKNLAQKRNLTQPPDRAKDNKMKNMIETKHDLLTTKYTKVLEEKDFQFNAPHTFEVVRKLDENTEFNPKTDLLAEIHFQEGPIKECGVNGVCNEDLLVMVVRRLEGFQNSEFKCRENACAITKIEEALLWLRKRTMGRENRGVEGTHEV